MKRYIQLYCKLQLANLRSRATYPLNFFIGVSGVALVGITNFILIWVLTRTVPIVSGWNYYEMLFLAALFQMTHGIFIILFQQLRQIESSIRKGRFDQYLIRPLSPLFQFLTSTVTISGFGDLVSGLLGLIYAGMNITTWDAFKIIYLIIIILSSTTIQFALYTIFGSTAFWTLQGAGLRSILNAFMFQFNQFPMNVYNKGVQIILTFLLGVAFISFYPSSFFFDKTSSVPFSPYLVFAPPFVAISLLGLSFFVWRKGILSYKGAGT